MDFTFHRGPVVRIFPTETEQSTLRDADGGSSHLVRDTDLPPPIKRRRTMSDPDFIKRASHEMNAALSFLEAVMSKTAVTVTAIRKGVTPLQRESMKLPMKLVGPSSVLPPQQVISGRPSIPRPPTQIAPGGLVGPSGKPLQPSAPAAPAPVKPLTPTPPAPTPPPPPPVKPAVPAPAPQRPTQGLEDLRAGPAPSKPAPLPSAAPAQPATTPGGKVGVLEPFSAVGKTPATPSAGKPAAPLKSSKDVAMAQDPSAARGTKQYQEPVPSSVLPAKPGAPAGGKPSDKPAGKSEARPKAEAGAAGPSDPQEYARMKQLVSGETPKELAEFHKATGTSDPSVTSPWKSGLLDASIMMGVPMAAGALLPEEMQMPAFIGSQLAFPHLRGFAQKKVFKYNPAEAAAARTSWMQGQSPEQYLSAANTRAAAPPK